MQAAWVNQIKTFADRLRQVRIRKFGDDNGAAAKAARALGIPEPTYYGHENGSRTPETDTIIRYAKFFNTTTDWLLYEKGDVGNVTLAPIVGYIGAGAEIIPMDDFARGDGLEMVNPPPGVEVSCVAARIRGDSMYPFKDGWVVFWTEHPHGVTDDCLGQLCVIKLVDGRMLLKELHRGSTPGYFNLISWNASPMINAAVEWAARVLGMTF